MGPGLATVTTSPAVVDPATRSGAPRPVLADPATRSGAPRSAPTDPAVPAAAPGPDGPPAGTGDPHSRRAASPADVSGQLDSALLAALKIPVEAPVTLLQFSSAFCAPCRATRRVLSEVSATLDGVRHVEVDAESHLAAVRALDIWRTPTTLVLAPGGRVVARAYGVPAKAQVIATVAALLDADQARPAAT